MEQTKETPLCFQVSARATGHDTVGLKWPNGKIVEPHEIREGVAYTFNPETGVLYVCD